MLRSCILLLLLLAPALAQSYPTARWIYIGQGPKGKAYVDSQTLERPEPGIIRFWWKQVGPKGREVKAFVQLDCKEKTYQFPEAGDRVYPIAPGSLPEKAYQKLCK